MSDPDLDADDDALAAMTQVALVALLNRLYARVSEGPMTASAARASTCDELRERILVVRRRVLARAEGTPASRNSDPQPAAARRASKRSSPNADEVNRRSFVVLVADDQTLARRARTNCGARGIVLVWASSTNLKQLLASITPTHVVVDGAAGRVDEASVRELAARGVRVLWCNGAQATLDALDEIA